MFQVITGPIKRDSVKKWPFSKVQKIMRILHISHVISFTLYLETWMFSNVRIFVQGLIALKWPTFGTCECQVATWPHYAGTTVTIPQHLNKRSRDLNSFSCLFFNSWFSYFTMTKDIMLCFLLAGRKDWYRKKEISFSW